VQVEFGGLNRGVGASDGELFDMRNLTGDHAPVLAVRGGRAKVGNLVSNINALFAHDRLWYVVDEFLCSISESGASAFPGLLPGPKVFAAIGDCIVIFPDKVSFSGADGPDRSFKSLESGVFDRVVRFADGSLFGESAEANTLVAQGVAFDEFFRPGDGVEISGCSVAENNKTAVVREVSGDRLAFSEYSFRLGGPDRDVPYTERQVSLRRVVPDLLFVCENENRLWGCDGNTIYASKLGDPFNWNVFEGLASDSWACDVGSPGRFTGCVAFMGYPVFFKEDLIYKVYGSVPENFEVSPGPELGVMDGCGGSIAAANETLFYLSRPGVVAYGGGVPRPVCEAFGAERFGGACAGSDGFKYFVSMAGDGGNGGFLLYVFDSLRGSWHIEDESHAVSFARWRGGLYMLNSRGEVWLVSGHRAEGVSYSDEAAVPWSAEFVDWYDKSPDKKGVGMVQIRVELDPGASVEIFVQFDSDGVWRKIRWAAASTAKKSFCLPIIPRRTDHYRLRLSGVGGCRVFSLARDRYSGSEQRV
jgi:hypothetical protein